jgi:Activator of Hsp90 ATPase homolog 1-like protein
VTGQQTAVRQVLRVEEFLPYSAESVWRALTDPELIARWLMPNDLRLETGHRFAIDSDPVRQCGLGGTSAARCSPSTRERCCGSPGPRLIRP